MDYFYEDNRLGYRSQAEVEALYDRIMANQGKTIFPAETYESGILAVLDWLTRDNYDHPLDE